MPAESEPSDIRASGAAGEEPDDNEDGKRVTVPKQTSTERKRSIDGLPEYLKSVVRANASIKDSLSGEPLDIDTQCVSVLVASATNDRQIRGTTTEVD